MIENGNKRFGISRRVVTMHWYSNVGRRIGRIKGAEGLKEFRGRELNEVNGR